MNNVTQKHTRRGRPRKFVSTAEKQKAYRDRKNEQAGFQIGTPVSHPQHGRGIIVGIFPERALVATLNGFSRCWLDLSLAELAIVGKRRNVPRWTDPNVILKDFKRGEIRFPEKNVELGYMPGVDRRDIPTYYKKQNGKRHKRKDFSRAINSRLVFLIERVKKNGRLEDND